LFFTISPNEKLSSWVLRISRYRKNDPFLQHADPIWSRLCGMDYPELAAKRRRTDNSISTTASACNTMHNCTEGDMEIEIDLPEYSMRQLATARDPLSVVEGHRLNVCLRLAWLLGVRMCPRCPQCNHYRWGCQDLLGSNMRPTGGTLGGVSAFEVGNEHQQHGTPHAHGQAHVVCLYQFNSLEDIAKKVEEALEDTKSMAVVEQMRNFHDWYHVERPLDPEEHAKYGKQAEEEFFQGFQDSSNAPLCVMPAFLHEDATKKEDVISWQTLKENVAKDTSLWQVFMHEGSTFAQNYLRHAQFVFNRVQHHVHKRDKDGNYQPLNTCKPKSKKKKKANQVMPSKCFCKADFPKSNVLTKKTVLVCYGMAKKFNLPVRGRRNALGLWQGQRSDEWQSGTTPSFAVHFGSNSHTMPNYRLPPTLGVHAHLCEDARCKEHAEAMIQKLTAKKLAKIAQRVQRESTGYYCGYTFKGQAIGKKYLLQATKSLDYMTSTLEDKTQAQRMHRITNRRRQLHND